MSHHTFAKGDRVAFSFDKSTLGTVTRSAKAETRVHWDSGHETPVDLAELVHAPAGIPAGFTVKTEDGINGQEFFYCEGPKANADQITVESFWDQPGGISFHITNDRHLDNGIFSREELEALPGMIKSVLETIDLAHTEQYLAEHPELLDNIKTVTDLARIADDHDLKVTGVFAVYEVRYKAELDSARINRQRGANNA